MKKIISLKYGLVMLLSLILIGGITSSVINASGYYADDEYYDEGDTITFRVQHKMGTFYQDTMNTYPSFIMEDILPEGVEYRSAAIMDSTGADLSRYGTLTYDADTAKVSFGMDETWLVNEANYKGQTITLTITTTATAPASSTLERKNTAYTKIGALTYTSNTVTFYSVKPAFTVTKTSDKEKYESGEEIYYSVTVAQTTDRTLARDVVITDGGFPSGIHIDMDSIEISDAAAVLEKGQDAFTVRLPEMDSTAPLVITYKAESTAAELTESEVSSSVSVTGKTVNGIDIAAEEKHAANIRNRIATEVENGTITETEDDIEVGESRKIEYTPDDGYYVEKVLVDGKEVRTGEYAESYTFDRILESHDIKAVCALIPEIAVTKTASKTKVFAGERILYTVEIENIKEGSSAEHIALVDRDMENGRIDIGTVCCEREHIIKEVDGGFGLSLKDPLDFGEKTTITYIARAEGVESAIVSNTAHVIAAGMPEPVSVRCETNMERLVPKTDDDFDPVLYVILSVLALTAIITAMTFGLLRR